VAALGDDAPVEDQADLVGAADVEVVVQDLLEEDPPGHRAVQHLGQRELRLQDRQLVAVAVLLILPRERVGQDPQPLAQQRLDLRRAQTVAGPLQPRHVIAGGEAALQRLEANPGLDRLALGPLVAVEAGTAWP
jgi:hypothetical protein